ncbi:hypothetical protein ACHAW6_005192 [Cyclotella cf. meneghiniana]
MPNGPIESDGGMSIWGTITSRIASLWQATNHHLADASRGELLCNRLCIAIVGRPNARKSSLLNLLVGRDAAIVSSTPGTTRDVVNVRLGWSVQEEKEDGVNEIEVKRMKQAWLAARDAQIIVGVVDATDLERGLEAIDELIRFDNDSCNSYPQSKSVIVMYVFNKLDVLEREDYKACEQKLKDAPKFGISCMTSEGIDEFLSYLNQQALSCISGQSHSNIEGAEGAVITRACHQCHVKAAAKGLEQGKSLSGQGYIALDMAVEELRLAASELGQITRAIDVEDILDVLFTDFCIGK